VQSRLRHVVWLCAWALFTGALVCQVPEGKGSRSRLPTRVISPGAPDNGEAWFVLARAYPTGRVPAPDVLDRAMRARRPSPGARPAIMLPGQAWVAIGPQPIFVQNSTTFTGRVTAIAPHPTSASTLYIGTDSGGIWRTADSGATWTPLTDTLPVPAIQSLAIDPVNPQLLYATTINRTYGTRWLRSIDGGGSWTVSQIVTDHGKTLSPALCSVNVFKACIPPSSGQIFIDPTRAGSPNTSTIYFTAASHLLRSDDSGGTFHDVFSLPVDLDFSGADAAASNPEAAYLRDAAIDPTRPDRLFAAVAQPHCVDVSCAMMTSTVAIYRSFDAGAHWSQQNVAALAAYSLAQPRYADPGAVYVPRVRLAVAASSPDTIAVAYRDLQAGRPRILQSLDAGDHWTETAAVAFSLTWPLGLAFSPSDSKTLYVSSDGVYRSTDGGQTWVTLGFSHTDNIVLTFNANRALLVGGDGGVYVGDAGTATTALTPLHNRLPITEFYSVASHPANGLLLAGGTQDNGTPIFQGGLGWSELVGGDGGDVVFDPSPQTAVLYAEVEWYFDTGGNVYQFFRCQSTGCVPRSVGIDKTLAGPFIPRMALDASSPSTLWLTAERLFRTDDRADHWTAASPSVAATQRCWQDAAAGHLCATAAYFTAAAVAPTSSATVYAGTLNGDVWLTADRGATWNSIAGPTAGPLPVRDVNDIVVDPLDAHVAYVAYSGFNSGGSGQGHIFRTPDGGQTWQDLSGNLPDVPVNTILIDPDSATSGSSTRVLYIGTDIGVFRAALDGSGAWQPFGTGLPPVVVNRLAYNAVTHQLLAATYGRGVWAISSRFAR
jgi:photosystem II stability/assembly factor-like uncharacterized protein